jgi:hypothetical protein
VDAGEVSIAYRFVEPAYVGAVERGKRKTAETLIEFAVIRLLLS